MLNTCKLLCLIQHNLCLLICDGLHLSFRDGQSGKLTVDDYGAKTGRSPGMMRQININGPLYVGRWGSLWCMFCQKHNAVICISVASLLCVLFVLFNHRRHERDRPSHQQAVRWRLGGLCVPFYSFHRLSLSFGGGCGWWQEHQHLLQLKTKTCLSTDDWCWTMFSQWTNLFAIGKTQNFIFLAPNQWNPPSHFFDQTWCVRNSNWKKISGCQFESRSFSL